ncbi:type II secretion system protein [Pseudocolwellia agarivorans]|uniref:type II secretion system protein n=1 Tax=Pseudocolwellia agarivorans TaxID=1911682 RepID=UPI0009872CD1|nr:type II secretion system protein [Pseudocolwellia agarivorans]
MNNKMHSLLKSKHLASFSYKAGRGFTIIELVLVIVLMGILAVTVAPKMFGSDGFEEHTYQAEVIATLRSIQLRAMQQTSVGGNACHTVIVSTKLLTVGGSCAVNKKNANDQALNDLDVKIDEDHNVTFVTSGMTGNSFIFDSNGIPANCSNPCNITIIGSDTLTVRIESQGYIHAI